ncbi:MAG: Ig-like domain-containing protein, partial [Myxococcaceae bacterium]
MTSTHPTFARVVAWSLLLGLAAGCGTSCGEDPTPPIQFDQDRPDATRSTIEPDRVLGVPANGRDPVRVRVTVRNADGKALSGRTVTVSVSGEGNTVIQPEGPTDAEGVAVAELTSSVAGTKEVTATVEAEGGAVTLNDRPTVAFVVLPASTLAFTQAPSTGTAGATLGVVEVAVQSADGLTVQSADHPV